MKQKKIWAAILGIIIGTASFVSCASAIAFSHAQDAYERGDYLDSAQLTMQALRHDDKNKDAIEFVEQIYSLAKQKVGKRVAELRASDRKDAWREIVAIYRQFNEIGEAYEALGVLVHPDTNQAVEIDVIYYTRELEEALPLAAEEAYNEAEYHEMLGTKEGYRSAYFLFEDARGYVNPYKDAADRARECREKGTDRVLVVDFRDYRPYNSYKTYETEIESYVLSSCMREVGGKLFLTFVDRDYSSIIRKELEFGLSGMIDSSTAAQIGNISSANILLTGEVTQIDVTENKQNKSTQDMERTYSSDGTEVLPKEYTAQFITYTKSNSVSMRCSFKLVDLETSTIIKADTVDYTADDIVNWYAYEGDKEALSAKQLHLVEDSIENPKRVPQDTAGLLREAEKQTGSMIADVIMGEFQ